MSFWLITGLAFTGLIIVAIVQAIKEDKKQQAFLKELAARRKVGFVVFPPGMLQAMAMALQEQQPTEDPDVKAWEQEMAEITAMYPELG